jgi:hypothetical protein
MKNLNIKAHQSMTFPLNPHPKIHLYFTNKGHKSQVEKFFRHHLGLRIDSEAQGALTLLKKSMQMLFITRTISYMAVLARNLEKIALTMILIFNHLDIQEEMRLLKIRRKYIFCDLILRNLLNRRPCNTLKILAIQSK